MFRIVSRYMSFEKENREEAVRAAALNAAAVFDDDDNVIADYRSAESENDERG